MTTTLLRRAGVAVLLAHADDALPAIVHWGADVGDLDGPARDDLVRALAPHVPHSALDEPVRVGLIAEPARGWSGRPGIAGRGPGAWSTAFRTDSVSVDDVPDGAVTCTVTASEQDLSLQLTSTVELTAHGVVRVRHELRNDGPDAYGLEALLPALPLPGQADELLDLTGRWCRERAPQRHPLHQGAWVRDARHGRTGHDATLLLVAGTAGFGFGTGEVWGVHTAWSGDHTTWAERLPTGEGLLGGGELLGPGEVVLAPGESYRTPWLVGGWSDAGLDGLTDRVHAFVRSRPQHPRRPRPVVLNTWEAVYMEHDLDTLRGLADAAAGVGVERFVLDDGWFHGRRDDRRGLGDWWVDTTVWPDGLHPLVDHVRELGMEFGLWVEPEMVNLDSDLAREHPDWVLRGREADPPAWRHQQVLDLQHPDAYAQVRDQLLALLDEYDIAFLKWDQNRDLVDAAHAGRPAVHGQTLAAYRLMDELLAAHPGLEIESCSSGGARVDLGVLEHTQRVWASDCNDALERQAIQRWTGLLLPPELVGSHIGPPESHTTGRVHRLGFRAATALFGHFGIEWDVAALSDDERAELAWWVDLYRSERDLLHSGRIVRGDHPDPALWVHGVVTPERGLFAVVQLASSPTARPLPVRLPGLDRDRAYRVEVVAGADSTPRLHSLTSWTGHGTRPALTGAALGSAGLGLPTLAPESALVLRVLAT